MRLILVQLPPMPIGPLTLAAIAAHMGVSVELIDFPSRGEEKPFLKYAAGADVVGISTVCSKYPRTLLLAKRLKTVSPQTLIVLGGPQATITARETLSAFPFVDLVIRGEAETAWMAFLNQLQRQSLDWGSVPGAAWRVGQRFHDTPPAPLCQDLDTLPMPAYGAYPALANYPFTMIEVGRGCPYQCTFCCTNTFFSRQPRMKSPQRIIAEMDHLHDLYGIQTFDFVHDMFTYRTSIVTQICKTLQQRSYVWGCSSRTDVLNEQLLDIMGAAGCCGFYFGIETGSPRMQHLLKKNIDVTEAVQIITMAKSKGFHATVSVIFGFPQETPNDIRDSLLLVTELMARDVDTLQLPVWGPLADTPLTESHDAYDIDGELSNFADTDGPPTAEEEELIRSNFQLFSTFYYPRGTAFNRKDYLLMTAMLEALGNFPTTKRFILEKDRITFVNFLSRGGFGIDGQAVTQMQMAETLLRKYAQSSRYDQAIVRLLAFDKAVERVGQAQVGWQENWLMGAPEAEIFMSRMFSGYAIGFQDVIPLRLTRESDGVQLSLGSL